MGDLQHLVERLLAICQIGDGLFQCKVVQFKFYGLQVERLVICNDDLLLVNLIKIYGGWHFLFVNLNTELALRPLGDSL